MCSQELKLKNIIIYFIALLFISNSVLAETKVKIMSLSGDVKVRYGLNEEWHKASVGLVLKDIDTIFNGENSRSILQLDDGSDFLLGPNSVLDVADLRTILEKEMFLILMSKKVNEIENKDIKTELKVGNVSVIHGMNAKAMSIESILSHQRDWSIKEINGAKALYDQNYFSNSIIKLHSILSRYDTLANKQLVYMYLAKAFEAIDKKGQAIDAYQNLINVLNSNKNLSEETSRKIEQAELAIKQLSN